MLLHRAFQFELNIETGDYISALIGLLENRSYEIEDDDEVAEGGLTLSAKARLILNRFVAAGWVDREYLDGSFTEVITPRTYAIQVMQLLHDLSDDQTREYNSLVFSTYSGLKEARDNQPHQMYEAVVNAKANTEKLVYELKKLYHGIRGYLRKIQGHRDVNVLLRDHFDEYKALADRIYHPIKTMDSVYRYMAPIREIITGAIGDSGRMAEMRKRAMTIRRYDSEEEAGREIIGDMDYILDVYQSLGAIVAEIDKKHSNYTKLSIDAIRYHMSADQTIGGKLVSLLKGFAASRGDDQARLYDRMERKLRINRQEFIDGRSLWHRNVKSRRISVDPLAISAEARLSEKEAERQLKFMRADYSLLRIRQYMDALFGDEDFLSTEGVDIPGDREFILLLLSAIRAGERDTNFSVKPGIGSLDINGYRIPKLTFSRKGGGGQGVE
ncbi:MAG: DUF5716 family protein [Clostridiales bacterium]|nr:DUF5716 family protein [Clostridiales bacterium]